MSKLTLGEVVVTARIDSAMSESPAFHSEVATALGKYSNLDWGDTCEEDCITNNQALANNERILAVYNTCKGKIWIITEWDRSVTTVLFPDEY